MARRLVLVAVVDDSAAGVLRCISKRNGREWATPELSAKWRQAAHLKRFNGVLQCGLHFKQQHCCAALLHQCVFAKACVHAGNDGVSHAAAIRMMPIEGDEEASDEGHLRMVLLDCA